MMRGGSLGKNILKEKLFHVENETLSPSTDQQLENNTWIRLSPRTIVLFSGIRRISFSFFHLVKIVSTNFIV